VPLALRCRELVAPWASIRQKVSSHQIIERQVPMTRRIAEAAASPTGSVRLHAVSFVESRGHVAPPLAAVPRRSVTVRTSAQQTSQHRVARRTSRVLGEPLPASAGHAAIPLPPRRPSVRTGGAVHGPHWGNGRRIPVHDRRPRQRWNCGKRKRGRRSRIRCRDLMAVPAPRVGGWALCLEAERLGEQRDERPTSSRPR
jgi:hypothetical protein